MASRTYDDPCGIARALDVVGERWALLIVRELLLGPKRYTELHLALAGASENVLSTRLRELEGAGVLQRRRLDPPAPATVYELTARGRELDPVLAALAGWGSRVPIESDRQLTPDAMVLAMRTAFDPPGARGHHDVHARYQLRLDGELFRVVIGRTTLEIGRGPVAEPDATITTGVTVLRKVLFQGDDLTRVLQNGDIEYTGPIEHILDFVHAFVRPVPDGGTAAANDRGAPRESRSAPRARAKR